MARIAFDLDETLATPIIDTSGQIESFQWRPGALELLEELASDHELVLWSVSSRSYIDKALDAGLAASMSASYSYDEMPVSFKDVRTIQADWLVDDAPHYKQRAEQLGFGERYIQVPAIGSRRDHTAPRAWRFLICRALGVPLDADTRRALTDPSHVACRLMAFAFQEIRCLAGPDADHERIHDLAYAFHNTPAQLASGDVDWANLHTLLTRHQDDYEPLFDFVFLIELFLSSQEKTPSE